MTQQQIEERIHAACTFLYHSDERMLIDSRAHERTITHYLTFYLRPLFNGWNVDPEYNREGTLGDPKRVEAHRVLVPDIIIHKRGSREGPNLVAIQVKGFWNQEDRGKDESDLRKLSRVYGYQFLYRLELHSETFELIRVGPADAKV